MLHFLFFDGCFQVVFFFIAGFVQLDIKVIVVRTKNCMSSYHTFLSIARNGVFQILILKHYEKWQKQAIIVFSISCNSQKCLIRDLAIFSSCNYYLYVQMEKSCNEKTPNLKTCIQNQENLPKKFVSHAKFSQISWIRRNLLS